MTDKKPDTKKEVSVVADKDPDSPFVYVDGKKEMKDGSGMVKE